MANAFTCWAFFLALKVRELLTANSSPIKPEVEILDLLEALQLTKHVAVFIARAARGTWSKKIGWQTKRQKDSLTGPPRVITVPLKKDYIWPKRHWALKQGWGQPKRIMGLCRE